MCENPCGSVARFSAIGLRWRFFTYTLADFEDHLAGFLVRIDHDVIAVEHLSVEDLQRERILNQLLDGALQRTRSEIRIVALREQQVFGSVGELERDLAIRQQAANVFQPQLDDLDQLLFPERAEDDDIVHTVQELGLEVRVQQVLDLLRGLVEVGIGLQALGLQELGADIRRHDDDGVLEIDHAPFAVSQAAIVHDLQQHVEDVRMRLLDFVKQDDRIGTTTDLLRELSTLFVADVSRRRADQSSHRVLLHVFGHIYPKQGVLVVEQEFG